MLRIFVARLPMVLGFALWCGRADAATLQVVPGAAADAAPSGDLCKTLVSAHEGDSIWIAEGTLTLGAPCLVQKRRLSVIGGYKADFSARDPFAQPTRLVVGNHGSGLLRVVAGADDLLLDGLVLDGGAPDAYKGSCRDCLSQPYNASLHPALLAIDSVGRVRMRALVFVNAPGGAVNALASGSLLIEGVAAVNSRPFAFRFAGACGYASPQCLEVTVRQSTLVWTWREAMTDGAPGGSAISVGGGANVIVDKTVIAYSDRLAIELDGTMPQQASVSDVVVFDNRAGDVGQMSGGSLKVAALAAAGTAVGLQAPATGRMERLALPWDVEYLQRYLARAQKPFYGVKHAWERAFMLSPAIDSGLKAPAGSRFSYEMAVSGGPSQARAPLEPKPDTKEDDKKDPRAKPKKKPKVPKKKGGR